MWPVLSPVPPVYRSLVKLMHWLVLGLVIALLASGNTPALKWSLIATVGVWALGFCGFGLLAKPGPALTGPVRQLFRPVHFAMMALPCALAISLLTAQTGLLTNAPRLIAIACLGAGLLHGIFHLWRHTALGDAALRNMTPRLLHGLL